MESRYAFLCDVYVMVFYPTDRLHVNKADEEVSVAYIDICAGQNQRRNLIVPMYNSTTSSKNNFDYDVKRYSQPLSAPVNRHDMEC